MGIFTVQNERDFERDRYALAYATGRLRGRSFTPPEERLRSG
jgi:hypothetical protein